MASVRDSHLAGITELPNEAKVAIHIATSKRISWLTTYNKQTELSLIKDQVRDEIDTDGKVIYSFLEIYPKEIVKKEARQAVDKYKPISSRIKFFNERNDIVTEEPGLSKATCDTIRSNVQQLIQKTLKRAKNDEENIATIKDKVRTKVNCESILKRIFTTYPQFNDEIKKEALQCIENYQPTIPRSHTTVQETEKRIHKKLYKTFYDFVEKNPEANLEDLKKTFLENLESNEFGTSITELISTHGKELIIEKCKSILQNSKLKRRQEKKLIASPKLIAEATENLASDDMQNQSAFLLEENEANDLTELNRDELNIGVPPVEVNEVPGEGIEFTEGDISIVDFLNPTFNINYVNFPFLSPPSSPHLANNLFDPKTEETSDANIQAWKKQKLV